MDAAVDPAGAVFHDGGLAATLRDLGRFGQLLLDGGVDHGRAGCARPGGSPTASPPAAIPGTKFAASGNASWLPGGGYRNQFWLPGGREVLLCLGIHGQMIWVEPARRLVVVKLSSWPLPQEPAAAGHLRRDRHDRLPAEPGRPPRRHASRSDLQRPPGTPARRTRAPTATPAYFPRIP